ncbi:MAG TPA: hypothetical protein HA223_05330 [Nanoarchaeota archaeon]|nr:hypothetical protein [Nanoarchaeota archaeon]
MTAMRETIAMNDKAYSRLSEENKAALCARGYKAGDDVLAYEKFLDAKDPCVRALKAERERVIWLGHEI